MTSAPSDFRSRSGRDFTRLLICRAGVLVFSLGCSTDVDLASRRDAGNRFDSYDECGNGMDDDEDGQIDEDCPCGADEVQSCFAGTYPHRLIGACRDGLQQCQTEEGAEFGRWQGCDGGAFPDTEICNGVSDEDCDGAIDEGCACDATEPRGCATVFDEGPCRPGRQVCADGLWGACEGAIGPSAELCSDTVDNDCDGQVNEGCDCLPAAEQCGDGIDNDCDGVVDEPASCGPPEVCGDGVDNNHDGFIDETCACECEASEVVYSRTFVTEEVWPSTYPDSWDRWNPSTSVWTGQETAFAIVGMPIMVEDGELAIYLDRYDNSGARLGMNRVDTGTHTVDLSSQLLWVEDHYVLANGGRVWLLSRSGELLSTGVSMTGALHWNGRELGRAWTEALVDGPFDEVVRGVFFRTYNADLSPLGPTISVSPVEDGLEHRATDLSSAGGLWFVAAVRDPPGLGLSQETEGLIWVLRGQSIVAERSLGIARAVQFAMGPAGALAFYSRPTNDGPSDWTGTAHYRRLDETGRLVGEEYMLPDLGPRRGPGATYWNCGYLIISPGFLSQPGIASASVFHLGVEGDPMRLPLPDEVLSGREDGYWYFFNAFNRIPAGAPNLIFAGRDRGGDGRRSRSGYSRVMMSCP